jgi:hypothetical protein
MTEKKVVEGSRSVVVVVGEERVLTVEWNKYEEGNDEDEKCWY